MIVTTKSSDNDYFMTDMVFLREGYNESYVKSSMSVEGIFTDKNLDAHEFDDAVGHVYVKNRRDIATKITRHNEDYYRYNIVTTLNHGLARQDKPLPSGIPIQVTFNRANATKGLLQINDKKADNTAFTYEEKTVPIINPILSCYFVESVKADQMYSKSKLYDVGVNFLDFSVRRELLMNGVAEHSLKIFEGKFTMRCIFILYSYGVFIILLLIHQLSMTFLLLTDNYNIIFVGSYV